MTTILRTQDLCFSYPDGGRQALHDVDVTIAEGEFVAVVGQNGSGKTTLAKHFNGLLRASKGHVEVDGRVITTQSTVELSTIVGYCYQNPDHQIFASTVSDEIRFGPASLGLPEDEVTRRTEELLDLVGLRARAQDYPFNLGRGERQQLAVASVLAIRPRILVVDEPTTGLDWTGGQALLSLIQTLNRRGTTVIAITHDMDLVAGYAHRMVVMADGGKIADGPPAVVFGQADVLEHARLRPPQVFRITRACPQLFRNPMITVAEAFEIMPGPVASQGLGA